MHTNTRDVYMHTHLMHVGMTHAYIHGAYMCVHIYIYMHRWRIVHYVCSKTSLNRPTPGPNLSGQFREVVDLGRYDIIMGDHLGQK